MSTIRRAPDPDVPFTMVPNATARDSDLPFASRGLLLWLLSHRQGWETSERAIAQRNKIGRDAVRSMLKPLEARGYLHRSKQTRESGQFGAQEWLVSAVPTVVGFTDHGSTDHGQSDHKEEQVKEDDCEEDKQQQQQELLADGAGVQPDPPRSPAPLFEEFWTAYPSKKGKAAAAKTWSKLNAASKTAAIHTIPAYLADCAAQQPNPRPLCHGSTYLAQRRWEDDYGAPAAAAEVEAVTKPRLGCRDCMDGWIEDSRGGGVFPCPTCHGRDGMQEDSPVPELPHRADLD